MRVRWVGRPAVVAGMVALLAAGCQVGQSPPAPATEIEIKIASAFPMTTVDSGGRDAAEAVRIAVARHRLVGKKFPLAYVPYDDSLAGSPNEVVGIQNAEKMVKDNQILGVVGPYTSTVATAEIPILSQANLVAISPSTTRDCLTVPSPTCPTGFQPPAGSSFFRISPRDSLQGTAMADFAYRSLKATRVAILLDEGSYAQQLTDKFKREWVALGGTVVISASYAAKSSDFAAFLREAHDGGAQAVYVSTSEYQNHTFCAARAQMKSIFSPTDAYFLVDDSLFDKDCLSLAGDNLTDHIISTYAEAPGSSLKGYTGHITEYTLEAYDCALILVDAIERAIFGNQGAIPTRADVLRAVAATKAYKGVTGTYTFNANGDLTAPVISLYQVKKDEKDPWKFLTSIAVDGQAA